MLCTIIETIVVQIYVSCHISDRNRIENVFNLKWLLWYCGTEFAVRGIPIKASRSHIVHLFFPNLLYYSMAQMEQPLLEIRSGGGPQTRSRFGFVAIAKEWGAIIQLCNTNITQKKAHWLLCVTGWGNKKDLTLLRTALEEKAGKKEYPLVASKSFIHCNQGQGERVSDFQSSLKQMLFHKNQWLQQCSYRDSYLVKPRN